MDKKVNDKLGEVRIADEVIAAIAGLAATEAKGVASLAGGIVHDQITYSKSRSLSRCVRVSVDDNEVAVKLALILDGSVPVPEVSEDAGDRVRNAVESMTGLTVSDIKITIAGVAV